MQLIFSSSDIMLRFLSKTATDISSKNVLVTEMGTVIARTLLVVVLRYIN